MFNLTNILEGIASSVAGQVGSAITSTLGFIVNGVQKDVVQPVSNGIGVALGAIESSVNALESAAAGGIQSTLSTVGNALSSFAGNLEAGFQGTLNSVTSGLTILEHGIATIFGELVSGVEQGFSAVASGVEGAIRQVASSVESGIGRVGELLANEFDTVFRPVAAFIAGLPQDVLDVAGMVVDAVKAVGTDVARLAEAAEKEVKKFAPAELIGFLKDIALGDFAGAFGQFIPEYVRLLEVGTGVEFTGDFAVAMGRITAIAGAEFAIGSMEEFFPGAAFIMARLLNHIADSIAVGDFRSLNQAGNLGSPNELLGVGELVRAKFRGNASEEYFYDSMGRHGIDKSNADILYKNSITLLGLNELVALYKRGIFAHKDALYEAAQKVQVPKEQVDHAVELYSQLLGLGEQLQMWHRGVVPEGWQSSLDDLVRSGFTNERIEALLKISFKLPSIFEFQDFVARKVDDEEHVKKFQLDTGINQEYFDLAKANGYDEKTAKRLYRMYWELPPFFALVQEYKIGKLKEADFRDALSFLRYTPYWQDVFIESLKPAITQAEIKEMYKFKLIEASEVAPKLVGIGLPEDLARQLSSLWQASVKQAAPHDQTADQVDAAALKGETKALIITAYKDSLIKSDVAHAELVALGVASEAAKLMISIADHDLQQQLIKDTFALDKEQYLAGNIGINEVLTDLTTAGATTIQQNKYLAQLQYAGRSKPKMPTLAEFIKWFKAQLINAGELVAALQLLGYSDTWIPYYLLEAGVTADAISNMGYTIAMPQQQM